MILLEVLAEAEARVENDPVFGDAAVESASGDLRKVALDGADHIDQRRKSAPFLRSSTSVHEDGAASEIGDGLSHSAVPGEAANVVHDLTTSLDRRTSDGRLIGVDGEDCFGTFALDAAHDKSSLSQRDLLRSEIPCIGRAHGRIVKGWSVISEQPSGIRPKNLFRMH